MQKEIGRSLTPDNFAQGQHGHSQQDNLLPCGCEPPQGKGKGTGQAKSKGCRVENPRSDEMAVTIQSACGQDSPRPFFSGHKKCGPIHPPSIAIALPVCSHTTKCVGALLRAPARLL